MGSSQCVQVLACRIAAAALVSCKHHCFALSVLLRMPFPRHVPGHVVYEKLQFGWAIREGRDVICVARWHLIIVF
jgi:hypothetical protein